MQYRKVTRATFPAFCFFHLPTIVVIFFSIRTKCEPKMYLENSDQSTTPRLHTKQSTISTEHAYPQLNMKTLPDTRPKSMALGRKNQESRRRGNLGRIKNQGKGNNGILLGIRGTKMQRRRKLRGRFCIYSSSINSPYLYISSS